MRKKSVSSEKADSDFLPGKMFSQADLDEVSDNPEWTEEDFAKARPFAEVFPELAAAIRRGRGLQKRPTKERVTIRIERATLDVFRATGEGWQTRMSDELAKAANRLKRRA